MSHRPADFQLLFVHYRVRGEGPRGGRGIPASARRTRSGNPEIKHGLWHPAIGSRHEESDSSHGAARDGGFEEFEALLEGIPGYTEVRRKRRL